MGDEGKRRINKRRERGSLKKKQRRRKRSNERLTKNEREIHTNARRMKRRRRKVNQKKIAEAKQWTLDRFMARKRPRAAKPSHLLGKESAYDVIGDEANGNFGDLVVR